MRNGILTFVLLLLCPLLFAQEALNNASVMKLVKAGLSEDLIVTTINTSAGNYDTSANGLIALKKATALDGSNAFAWAVQARALSELQRFDEAIEVALRISAIDPDDVLAHTSLSVLYQKKGMIPEAEAEGAKARVLGWKQQLKKSGA